MRLEANPHSVFLIWYSKLDKRNGYWGWNPVGAVFNRRNPLHWVLAITDLWRKGDRRR